MRCFDSRRETTLSSNVCSTSGFAVSKCHRRSSKGSILTPTENGSWNSGSGSGAICLCISTTFQAIPMMSVRLSSTTPRKEGIHRFQPEPLAGGAFLYCSGSGNLPCSCSLFSSLFVAGSSSSSLWSRVTTKRRDPSSAATFHLSSRRHPSRKTAASFFARRDRPWSSGTCPLAVNRAQRGGVSY